MKATNIFTIVLFLFSLQVQANNSSRNHTFTVIKRELWYTGAVQTKLEKAKKNSQIAIHRAAKGVRKSRVRLPMELELAIQKETQQF
jgi:hypothetical protein